MNLTKASSEWVWYNIDNPIKGQRTDFGIGWRIGKLTIFKVLPSNATLRTAAGLEKVPISPWLVTLLHICGVTPTPQLPETPRDLGLRRAERRRRRAERRCLRIERRCLRIERRCLRIERRCLRIGRRYRRIEWRVFDCFMMFHNVLREFLDVLLVVHDVLLLVHDVLRWITMFYMCFMMFYYVWQCFMFSESRNDRRRRIDDRRSPQGSRQRRRDRR